MCIDSIRNTGVVCDDTGRCIGTYKGRFAGLPRPRGNFVPPEGIVDQGDSYVPESQPQDVPRGGKPSGDIIY